MAIIAYDKNGDVLDKASIDFFGWQRIIPDTYGEKKYDAAYARVWR